MAKHTKHLRHYVFGWPMFGCNQLRHLTLLSFTHRPPFARLIKVNQLRSSIWQLHVTARQSCCASSYHWLCQAEMTERLLLAKAAQKTSKPRSASKTSQAAPALAALPAPETTKKRSRRGPCQLFKQIPSAE